MRTTTFFVLFFCFAFFLSNNHVFSQTAGTVTAGNWYRIASNPGNRANATFTLRDVISGGGHSTLEFRAGISFGYQAGISFTLLNHNYYSHPTFTKVRILENDTYDPQYLEVYVERSGSVNFSVYDNLQSGGWVAESWTAGSIPTGYVAREYDVNKLFVVGDYDDRFTVKRGGNVGIGVTDPSEKLEVAGKIFCSGENGGFKFPDSTVQKTAVVNVWKTVDNDAADDATAIKQALETYKQVSLLPNRTYYINSTITIDQGQTLHVPQNTILKYNGSSSTAIIMKNWSVLSGDGTLESDRSIWNWNDGKIAVKIYGWSVKIDFGVISGFEYGIYLAENKSISTGHFTVGNFWNCVIAIFIYPTVSGFVNNNYFHLGSTGSDWKSTTNGKAIWDAHSTGIWMDFSGEHDANANTFSGCIQGYNTGIRLAGAFNRLEGLRLEDCTYKVKLVSVFINNVQQTRSNYLFGEYDDPGAWAGKIETDSGITSYKALQCFGVQGVPSYSSANHYVNGSVTANQYLQWSDSSLKKNIQSLQGSLNKILALRGTTFEYQSKEKSTKTDEGVKYGFIAQELKEVLPELVITDKYDSLYAIDYNGIIPVLVEAFKEQNTLMEDQQTRIDELENEVRDMADMMKKANLLTDSLLHYDTDKAALFQNTPNPFSKETEIGYYLPETAGEAYILIMDMNGRFIKRINITAKGENSIIIKGGTLTPGMYIYTLIAGNKEIGTKRMVLTE